MPLNIFTFGGKQIQIPSDKLAGKCRSVEKYEKMNRIGEGTYGIVYKARNTETGEIVALKKIRLEPEADPSARPQQPQKQEESIPPDGLPLAHFREILLLKNLKHPNVVHVHEIVVGRSLGAIFTVMEYCVNDLAALVDSMPKPFTPGEVKCILWQLLKGLDFLHKQFIIHRDLKLSNLLLSSDGTLKIADFGLARKFGAEHSGKPSRPMTPKVVTLWYRAPELLYGDPDYSIPVDMWSFGCIFGELILNAPLLPGGTEIHQLTLIATLLGSPKVSDWPNLEKLPLYGSFTGNIPRVDKNSLKSKFPQTTPNTLELIESLLMYDPERRFTVRQCLDHPYFTEAPRKVDKQFMRTFPDQRQGSSNKAVPVAPKHPEPSSVASNHRSSLTNLVEGTGKTSKSNSTGSTSINAQLKRRANAGASSDKDKRIKKDE